MRKVDSTASLRSVAVASKNLIGSVVCRRATPLSRKSISGIGITLLATLLAMVASATPSAMAAQPGSSWATIPDLVTTNSLTAGTSTPFNFQNQLICIIPSAGQWPVTMTISGSGPKSITTGQAFYLQNVSTMLTIPMNGLLGQPLYSPTAATATASQITLAIEGVNSPVDIAAPPYGPLTSALTPVSEINPLALTLPQSPIATVGPITAGADVPLQLAPVQVTFDLQFQMSSGTTTSLGSVTCSANPVPHVTSISPSQGPEGGATVVEVQGSGFTGATSVSFGTNPTPFFSVVSDSVLYVFATPGYGVPLVDVTVTTPNGTSADNPGDVYSYDIPAAPVVTSVSPSSGPVNGGTILEIQGTNLTATEEVNFGSSSTPFLSVVSDSILYVITPPASRPGPVEVTVTTHLGTSAAGNAIEFNYQ